MGTKTDTDIERPLEMQRDWWSELMQRFTLQAGENRDLIPMLLNANALGHHSVQGPAKPELHISHLRSLFRALRQMNHARAVFSQHRLFRVIVQALSNDQDYLAVVVALGIGKTGVSGEGNVAGHLFPEEAKLIALIPDVVSGRGNRILLRRWIIAGAARHERAAHIGLSVKDADWGGKNPARSMKICGRWNLLMCCRTRQSPIRNGRGCLSMQHHRGGENQSCDRQKPSKTFEPAHTQ